ncbi:hypothetical protein FB451DRAFT_1471312 [Mycena latifolia]|nr:hypothetical protein FB451DRAFT_1471312 [Mycena latifolia]
MAMRKRRHENSDLYEKPDKRSRTSKWRDENQLNKKARVINAQPSIATLFKVLLVNSHDSEVHVRGPNLSLALQAAEHVLVDSDSDIEMTSAPHDLPLDLPESHPSVWPIPDTLGPIEPPLHTAVSSTAAPAPARDSLSNDGYSTGDSDDDRKTHQLSLAAIEDTFKKFDAKIKKYRKAHLSPRAITAMTPEKGVQRMVMINGLTEFNIQRRKHELERANLAIKIDIAPRPQGPKLRARLRKMKPSIAASITVANQFSKTKYWAQKLRSTARIFSATGELPENNQGKGTKHKTHFDDPDVKPRLEAFARGLVPEAEGGFKGRIAPDKLRRYVNEFLFPELEIEDTIGVTTATAWLKKLGYRLRRYQKGIYFDGHERPDVVEKRTEFIKDMFACLQNAYQYEDEKEDDTSTSQSKNTTGNLKEISPQLKPGDVIYYPIFHDESTVHANDQSHFVWETDDQHELRKKERGRLIHISDFIIEHCGRLVLTAEEIEREELLPKCPLSPAELKAEEIRLEAEAAAAAAAAEKERIALEQGKKPRKKRAPKEKQAPKAPPATDRTTEGLEWTPPPPPAPFKRYRCEHYDACRIIHPGSGHDPYWDMPQLIAQTKGAIDIFEAKYPDGRAVFVFDCSSAHEAFAIDALVAHKMNRSPGGKQPKMHATINPTTGERQSMVFEEADNTVDSDGKSLLGQPKGMEQVLRERGLLDVLNAAAENRKHGSTVVGICRECAKSQKARDLEAKARHEGQNPEDTADEGAFDDDDSFRERADGTFPTAQKLVPECIEAVSLDTIRRFFRHCYRYMDAYRHGLNPQQAARAVKKYSSHRRIPVADVAVLKAT